MIAIIMVVQIPLAERLRPTTLDAVVGQIHLVGPQGILRSFVDKSFLPSIIFWGPPGVGKTTIAKLLASIVKARFESKSAVTSNVAEIRKIIEQAKHTLLTDQQKTVLFIDEIHRFNKSQQDALLPAVEDGTIIFIGATTENPSFEVNSPLLSRCRVLLLKELEHDDLVTLLERGTKLLKVKIEDLAKELLIDMSNHDGRQLLTILEIAATLVQKSTAISVKDIEQAVQKKAMRYDQAGEEHYNTISAFIKSMRASNIDAALYYLARMVAAGEDPLFIARRMVIFAAEDIGLSQPTAQVVANSVFDAVHKVGYPEAQVILAFGVSYLSQAQKDRSSYDAYFTALQDVEQLGNLPIPLTLRNASTTLMKNLDYSKGYQMYSRESLLPDKLKGKTYYHKPQK